jgi:hypothetical protein
VVPDALTKARDENKPILLSIGYSACHWCHVMAHESFEDEATAKTMNELFVNIKVDREERPDLDKVVSDRTSTADAAGRRLAADDVSSIRDTDSVFSAAPIFRRPRAISCPASSTCCCACRRVFRDQRDELAAQGTKLANVFGNLNPATAPGQLKDDVLLAAARGSTRQPVRRARRRLRHRAEVPDADDDRTIVAALGLHRPYAPKKGAPKDRETLEMAMITLTHIGVAASSITSAAVSAATPPTRAG